MGGLFVVGGMLSMTLFIWQGRTYAALAPMMLELVGGILLLVGLVGATNPRAKIAVIARYAAGGLVGALLATGLYLVLGERGAHLAFAIGATLLLAGAVALMAWTRRYSPTKKPI